MEKARRISKGLHVNKSRLSFQSRRYITPSRRHQEPKHLSWQWLVMKTPGITGCKDLCFPKQCPKKSFFPRISKAYIPAERKSCELPKKKMTWKEYFSFLWPTPAKKPPLVMCRKLQAERRRACSDPFEYPGDCIGENCCPPAKEWFGQAVVYHVPNPFPELKSPRGLMPCVPSKPPVAHDPCPTRKDLDMDAYAYKTLFSNVCVCDPEFSLPCVFKCNTPCRNQPEKIEITPTCFISEFKDTIGHRDTRHNLPPQEEDVPHVVSKSSEQPPKPKPKEFEVEEKNTACERQSFLKPFRFGKKYSGMDKCRKYHTMTTSLTKSFIQNRLYSDNSGKGRSSFPGDTVRFEQNHNKQEQRLQPTHSGWEMASLLKHTFIKQSSEIKALPDLSSSGQIKFGPTEFNNDPDQSIDPEVMKFAEETNQKVRYGVQTEKLEDEGPTSLLKQLSNKANKRLEESKEENPHEAPIRSGRTKLSLCKTESLYDKSRSNFSTHCINFSNKSNKRKTICSGCPGVRQAEEEDRNPPPKSFLDCKMRSAGKCRGPTRKLAKGEPEPDNPYQRNRARPFSRCNKPRSAVCKKERGYKIPCEPPKREFHTFSYPWNSPSTFTPLNEIMKSSGIHKNEKYRQAKTNLWDSHTIESYIEPEKGNAKVEINSKKNDSLKLLPDEGLNSVSIKKLPPLTMTEEEEWDNVTTKLFKNKLSPQENQKAGPGESGPLGIESELFQSASVPQSNVKESNPVSLWESVVAEKVQANPTENIPKIPEGNSDSDQLVFHPLNAKKPRSTGGGFPSKPTRLSAMFKSRAESRERSPVMKSIHRRDGKDQLNPMEE